MEEIFIKAHDGYNLFLNVYEAKNPKAVVQIAHGMEEHQGRYKRFAKNNIAMQIKNASGHVDRILKMTGIYSIMPKIS